MKVIVVGGGLGGLAITLGLVDIFGFSVELIEKQSRIDGRRGASIGLAPNGAKALREIIGESPVDKLLSKGKGSPERSYLLPWWRIRDTLLDLVEQKRGRVNIHTGCQLNTISDMDGYPVQASCIKDGSHFDIEGDFLIGADGVNSAVRDCLGLPESEFSGSTVWRGYMNASDVLQNTHDETTQQHTTVLRSLLDGGPCPLGFVKIGNSLLIVMNHHPETSGMLTWTISTKEEVSKGSHPRGVLDDVEKDSKYEKVLNAIYAIANSEDLHRAVQMKTIHPKTWGGSGRLTLLGDAAHAVRPATGLGCSLAFEDCVILIRKLRKANKDYHEIISALREYEDERLERVQIISENESKKSLQISKGEESRYTQEFLDWIYAGV